MGRGGLAKEINLKVRGGGVVVSSSMNDTVKKKDVIMLGVKDEIL